MSTASRNCRFHVQRLQERGKIAPRSIGSRREDPWILRSPRLGWLNNLSGKLTVPPTLFRKVLQLSGRGRWTPYDLGLCKNDPYAKIAASLYLRERFSEKSDNFSGARGGQALSLTNQTPPFTSICRLEARAGTSPPPSFLQMERRPP